VRNKTLSKVYKNLSGSIEMDWFNDNAIMVYSSSFKEYPDVQLIYEKSHPDTVIISVSVSSDNAPFVAQLVLSVMYINNVAMAEPFFIDRNNNMYWGMEAYKLKEIDNSTRNDKVPDRSKLH